MTSLPLVCTLLLALTALSALTAPPVLAGSQSSNSSSNCSNGRCTRVDSYVVRDGRRVRGWQRVEVWNERPGRRIRTRR